MYTGGTGALLIILSIVTGLYTYSVSDLPFGVGNDHRADALTEDYSHREWLEFQLNEYDDWTTDAADVNRKNVLGLHLTQFCLFFGLVLLLASVLISAEIGLRYVIQQVTITTVIVIVVAVILLCVGE